MPSTDLSEFKALSGKSRKPHCSVAAVLEDIPDRDTLEAALAADDFEITSAGISRWLARRDREVPWQAIRTHRNGSCACKHEQL